MGDLAHPIIRLIYIGSHTEKNLKYIAPNSYWVAYLTEKVNIQKEIGGNPRDAAVF